MPLRLNLLPPYMRRFSWETMAWVSIGFSYKPSLLVVITLVVRCSPDDHAVLHQNLDVAANSSTPEVVESLLRKRAEVAVCWANLLVRCRLSRME